MESGGKRSGRLAPPIGSYMPCLTRICVMARLILCGCRVKVATSKGTLLGTRFHTPDLQRDQQHKAPKSVSSTRLLAYLA